MHGTKTIQKKVITPHYTPKEYLNALMHKVLVGDKNLNPAQVLAVVAQLEAETALLKARAEARIDNINAEEYKRQQKTGRQ